MAALPVAAAAVGQIDTFSTGTQGWHVGNPMNPNQPSTVATGGPAGAGDAFLRLISDELSGPNGGNKLDVMNDAQWAGNYGSAGIGAISMDVNNMGTTDLFLRLLLETANPAPGPPLNAALTTVAQQVPANSGWIHIVFPLMPGDLTAVLGTATGARANVDQVRLFHNPDPTFFGPPSSIPTITAELGVDNIQALAAVPEPATLGLVAFGLGAAAAAGRRRRSDKRQS
jgi:hypothetical protein